MPESNRVTRDTLYEDVWCEPVTAVAPRYGLSDVGLAKLCRRLQIPLPERGYWAKHAAGRAHRRPPLPPLPKGVSDFVLLERCEVPTPPPRVPLPEIAVPDTLTDPLPLTRAAAQRLRRARGWDTPKGLRTAPHEVLHLEVTAGTVERALRLIDTVLKLLATVGVTVHIDAARGQTLIEIAGTVLPLQLTEALRRTRHDPTPAERRAQARYRWDLPEAQRGPYPRIPDYDYHPTGRLAFTAGRWPSRSWNDTAKTPLEHRLSTVVYGILDLAESTRQREDAERRREEQRARAEALYAFLHAERVTEQAQLKALETEATNWHRAATLRAYINARLNDAATRGLPIGDVETWATWAHAKADAIDPLVPVSDLILDAPEPKPPRGW